MDCEGLVRNLSRTATGCEGLVFGTASEGPPRVDWRTSEGLRGADEGLAKGCGGLKGSGEGLAMRLERDREGLCWHEGP